MVSMGNAPDQLLPSDYVGLYNSILCQSLPSVQYALPIDFTYRPQAPTELVPMRTGRCQFSLLFFGPDFALCLNNKPSSKEYKSLFFALPALRVALPSGCGASQLVTCGAT